MLLTNPTQVELYAAGDWQDIKSRVRANGADGIEIEYGNQGMSSGIPEPSSCRMTLDNRDGALWPDNPMSEFYGSIGQNTPIRVALGLLDFSFSSTVVNGWGPVTGQLGSFAVTNTGVGGTVAASNFQQTGGVGTHLVSTTVAHRRSVLDTFNLADCEQQIDFQVPANVTGGDLEPANLLFRCTATDYVMLRVTVLPDDTITIRFLSVTLPNTDGFLTIDYPAPVMNTGQWLRVKGNVEMGRVQAKIWNRDDPEPLEWVVDEDMPITDFLSPGGVGVRTGVGSSNTNIPVTVSYDNWIVRSIRFYGEISEWPLEVHRSGKDITIPIVASGVSRRFSQGQQPAVSALRRALPDVLGLVAYWPLEEETGSTSFASALPGHPPMYVLQGTPGYGEFTGLPSSQPLPTGNGSDWSGLVPTYTNTGVVQVRFVLNLPAGGQPDLTILCRWYTDHPSAKLWQLVYRTGGDLVLQAWNSETAFVYQSSVLNTNLDGDTHVMSVLLTNNGSDVDWEVNALRASTGGSATLDSGTAPGLQVATVKRVWMNLNLQDTSAFGHVTVQSEATDILLSDDLAEVVSAYNGDFLIRRMERLLAEYGIECSIDSASVPNFQMGRQRAETLNTLVEEPITLDSGGVFYDGRTYAGVNYRDRTSLYNQDPQVTLSYAARQLTPPFQPRRDDRDIRNKITATRQGGSEGTYELATGRYSTLPPGQGGVGVYDSSVTVNPFDDKHNQQIAAWRVALGTVNAPRFTAATVNLAAPALQADPSIQLALLDLRPGHLFKITDAEDIYQFDDIRQLVAGYREYITQKQHIFTLNGVPVEPFEVFVPGDADLGRFDSDKSSLENAITTSQTTFTVPVEEDGALWTEDPAYFPFDINVGGERMTATGIATVTPSFLAAGTAAHADNASVSPGLPGGGTTTGDLLLILAGTRDLNSSPTYAGSEYVLLLDAASMRIWGKIHDGTESAPTIGVSGGSAGVTVSAQMCSFRNLPLSVRKQIVQGNGASVQNIALPALHALVSKGIAIYAGWKPDDWTSVATLAGATEIGEPSSTLGSDQGIVWDYRAYTGQMFSAIDQFVVTGGSSQVSRSGVLVLGNWQTWTVTRSVNGVVKSHAAGTPVRLFRPPRWAL